MDVGYSSHKEFNIKQLVILGLIILGLPILIIAAGTINNDIRNRAAGSNEVTIKFSPSSGTFSAGQDVSVKLSMNKLATRTINVSGAQAVVSVANKFTITSATCDAPFNGLPFTKVEGSTITVICAIATGSAPVSLTSADKPFATLNLKIANQAASGTATLGFTSTRATEAGISGSAPDVSTAGAPASFTIGAVSGPTTSQNSGGVSLSFSPATVSLPPNATVKIMANAGSKSIAFTKTVITFDKAKINLAGEITTNPILATTVEKTAVSAANAQGRANIVIAAAPGDQQPTGSFEVASFQIAPVSGSSGTTTVSFSTADAQYVDSTQANLTVTGSSLNVTLGGGGGNTAAPTQPSTGGDSEIPVGTKDSITVNIGGGGGDGPKITFSAALSQTQNNPDLYFKLRVKDELYFQENPGADLTPQCNTANAGEKDFYIPMRAAGNVYKPVASIQASPPGPVASVTSDGWVTLAGVTPNKFYTLILKAPKFRASQVEEHVTIAAGQNQPYDFTGIPLEPGDVPDPNNSLKQDCTVNSIDISLIVSAIGSTIISDLEVADVNFDNIVNGNDVSKVVNTLSTKPDDDL